ncbi:MAG: hypothetical protein QOC92_2840 [Acidimicrobiaceae bacterium]
MSSVRLGVIQGRTVTDDHQLNAVLAHSLLGTVAAIKGAIDTVMAHDLDGSTRDSLLMMAQRRLDFLSEQLRDLALGLPDEIVGFLEELRQFEQADDATTSPG